MINGVGNADLSRVYKGPVVPLQSLHTVVVSQQYCKNFGFSGTIPRPMGLDRNNQKS